MDGHWFLSDNSIFKGYQHKISYIGSLRSVKTAIDFGVAIFDSNATEVKNVTSRLLDDNSKVSQLST